MAASFALLDFLAFFFFFFLAAVEVDGAVAVAVASSASGGDGGGVKTWTGSAAVQESVSEVEVMGWKVKPMKPSQSRGQGLQENERRTNLATYRVRASSSAARTSSTMHLMYTLNENGDRVYTLKVPANHPYFARTLTVSC